MDAWAGELDASITDAERDKSFILTYILSRATSSQERNLKNSDMVVTIPCDASSYVSHGFPTLLVVWRGRTHYDTYKDVLWSRVLLILDSCPE